MYSEVVMRWERYIYNYYIMVYVVRYHTYNTKGEMIMIKKQLCKWFDDDKKGYVTIKDIIPGIPISILIGLYLCGIYFVLTTDYTNTEQMITWFDYIESMTGALAIVLSCGVVFFSTIFLITKTRKRVKDLKVISYKGE